MNIIGTGLSGLVGSRIVELLSPRFLFEDLSLDTGLDITNEKAVRERIGQSRAPWVFHFAAKTDVDGAQKERALGTKSSTWIVNVIATQHVVSVCRETGKRLLYISTDFVFDGTSLEYREDAMPNPQGWYAVTKYEGEKRVAALGEKSLIIRIANPYRKGGSKLDFARKIIDMLTRGQSVAAPIDQLFVPTLIDDIGAAIEVLINNNASGIYHVVGSQGLSPYDAAKKIAASYDLDASLVRETSFEEYFRGRAPRPKRAVLKSDKIDKLGIKMHSFDEGLKLIR